MTNKIENVLAHHAFNELRRRKLDTYAALQRADLSQLSVMDTERWIPFDKSIRFLEAAADIAGDDCFGVHLGTMIDPRTIGLIAYIGVAARTLDDAFRNTFHYLKIHNAAIRCSLKDDGSKICLKTKYLQSALHRSMHAEEFNASLDLQVARWLTQRDISPVEVHFIHSRENNRDEVERVLGCPVLFDQDTFEIIFQRDDMLLPVPTADDHLLRVLCKQADRLLEDRAEQSDDFIHAVTELIIGQLATGQVTVNKIAHDLGTSKRTLSRRLAERGTTFDNLFDDIRHELAMSYLDQGDIKLQDLAFLLGFSSHSSFTAAFKRWTGKTPREVRALS